MPSGGRRAGAGRPVGARTRTKALAEQMTGEFDPVIADALFHLLDVLRGARPKPARMTSAQYVRFVAIANAADLALDVMH